MTNLLRMAANLGRSSGGNALGNLDTLIHDVISNYANPTHELKSQRSMTKSHLFPFSTIYL